MSIGPGLHEGVSAKEYFALSAIGSTRLSWLAVSPKYYQHMLATPQEPTATQRLGSAVHSAVLEPELFVRDYCAEPDVTTIPAARPRATNEYRARCEELVAQGKTILRDYALVDAMACAVRAHPLARRVLERAVRREITMVWTRGGRLCRGRIDALGDPGLVADLKTTRTLRGFSPWELTRYGYHRQMAHYCDGVRVLDVADHPRVVFVVVESSPPHDVGVFELDRDALAVGEMDCERLLARLDECEETGQWPGMFPEIQQATITEHLMYEASMEGAELGQPAGQ